MNLTTDHDLLTDDELCARLRCKKSKFYELLRSKQLDCFMVARPLTRARWSRAKLEQYARGESLVKFGRGSRG